MWYKVDDTLIRNDLDMGNFVDSDVGIRVVYPGLFEE